MKSVWKLAEAREEGAGALADLGDLSPHFMRCLRNRGLDDLASAQRFLEPRLRDLSAPETIPNMEAAVARLWEARERQEPVTIFGDYDVDGVSASAILYENFQALGISCRCFIPDRFEEGYGLTWDAANRCLQTCPSRLLVAVDCGSTAVDTIDRLGKAGVDVVVLDHHELDPVLPRCCALVNPRLSASGDAGMRDLCSAGLAFKLAHALVKHGRALGVDAACKRDIRASLDLVALGTIADLVPLSGENRILASCGLKNLNLSQRPGLVALKEISRTKGTIGTFEVGFQLAPRLNAAGRLETASAALDLLLTPEPARARRLASDLDARNRERQEIERSIAAAVIDRLHGGFDPSRDYVVVEADPSWHIGVVGIVASRVLQEFYRPTFILGGDGPLLRGSGRSIEGFDLASALSECGDCLVRHGGHAMAAGLTMRPERVDEFRARLNRLAASRLAGKVLKPTLRLDTLVPLSDLTLKTVLDFERLQPFGQGNPVVQVVVPSLTLVGVPKRMGRDQQHLRFEVSDGCVQSGVVWWNGAGQPFPSGSFDLACVPEINRYNGREVLQLRLLDWREVSERP